MTAMKERIIEARIEAGIEHPAHLAKLVGVKPAAAYAWESGATRTLKGEVLVKLADALSVTPQWLVLGRLPKRQLDGLSGHVFVKFWKNAEAAAGLSSINEEYAEIGGLAFLEKSLRNQNMDADQCEALRVRGESMMPDLRPGDTVVYDTGDTRIRDGKMYVISWADDGLLVKRLFKELDGRIRIVSTNQAPEFNDRYALPGEDGFLVVGRVRWVGRWEN